MKVRAITQVMSTLCHTRPKASAREAADVISDKIDTVVLMVDGLHDFITSLKMAEWLCLIMEKANNGFESVATLEFDGDRMVCQRDAVFFSYACRAGSKMV